MTIREGVSSHVMGMNHRCNQNRMKNSYWLGLDLAKFGVLASFCDLVVCGVKNENHGFAKLARLNPHKCLQSDVGEVWDQKELILAWLVQCQVP